jgi:hypothetical protein
LEKYRPPAHKFQNIFATKSQIQDRNQWPGDFIAGLERFHDSKGTSPPRSTNFQHKSAARRIWQRRRAIIRSHIARRFSKTPGSAGRRGDPAGIFAYPSLYLAWIRVALWMIGRRRARRYCF